MKSAMIKSLELAALFWLLAWLAFNVCHAHGGWGIVNSAPPLWNEIRPDLTGPQVRWFWVGLPRGGIMIAVFGAAGLFAAAKWIERKPQ